MLQLAEDLSISPVYVIGHLHALWHTVLEQQEDGDLSAWPDAMIANAASYDGDATKFVLALQSRNWLDGHLVHDWIEYAGLFLTKKYSTSNIPKLREIWKKHGCKYGKRDNKSLYRLANRKRTESELKANLPNLTKPNLTKPNLNTLALFDIFWNAYPKRKSKGDAEKAFNAIKPSEQLLETMLLTIGKAKTSEDWKKEGGKFIPYPATWLRAKGWEDEYQSRGGQNGIASGRHIEPAGSKYSGIAK